jgi:hypothetical protein
MFGLSYKIKPGKWAVLHPNVIYRARQSKLIASGLLNIERDFSLSNVEKLVYQYGNKAMVTLK